MTDHVTLPFHGTIPGMVSHAQAVDISLFVEQLLYISNCHSEGGINALAGASSTRLYIYMYVCASYHVRNNYVTYSVAMQPYFRAI